jgi:hypothetical protein
MLDGFPRSREIQKDSISNVLFTGKPVLADILMVNSYKGSDSVCGKLLACLLSTNWVEFKSVEVASGTNDPGNRMRKGSTSRS